MFESESEDPRIAAFARSNRHRNAIVFAILGALIVIGSGITLAVLLAQPVEVLENAKGRRPGAGFQLIVVAGGGVIVGFIIMLSAIRIWRGEIRDLTTTTSLGSVAFGDQPAIIDPPAPSLPSAIATERPNDRD